MNLSLTSRPLIVFALSNLSAYQTSGIQQLILLKKDLLPFNFNGNGEKEKKVMSLFIETFCEHQLADNDYMNLLNQKNLNNPDDSVFYELSLENVLKYITHIIWTDKVVPGYFISKVRDNSIYHLMNRLEKIKFEAKNDAQNSLIRPSSSVE